MMQQQQNSDEATMPREDPPGEYFPSQERFADECISTDLNTYSDPSYRGNWGRVQQEIIRASHQATTTLSDQHRQRISNVMGAFLVFLINNDQQNFSSLNNNINVPTDVFQLLLQEFPDAINYRDTGTGGLTPLYQAIANGLPNLVHCILETDCTSVRVPLGNDGILPIELLAQRLVMSEEVLKYQNLSDGAAGGTNDDNEATDNSAPRATMIHAQIDNLWECVRIVIAVPVCSRNGTSNDQPLSSLPLPPPPSILHALLSETSTDIPMSLFDQALRRNQNQLSMPDSNGNLPLHLVASKQSQDDDDHGETFLFLLKDILNAYPAAAWSKNNDGLLPVDLAIAAGRRWDTGISALLDTNPAGLCNTYQAMNVPRQHYSLIFNELLNRHNRPSIVYAMLQSNPGAIFVAHSTTE